MKLYAKEELQRTLISMKRSGRTAHGFLFTGESGSGRTFSARYAAMTLLCDAPLGDGSPCGECRQCRRIAKDIHPDVILPEGEGKAGIYSVAFVRENIVADAYTAPNDCSRKVYIIRNCEKLPKQSQDALLKIVEEPPDHVYFIFTALSRNALLSTLLSRVVTVHIGGCTHEQAREALSADPAHSADEINDAVRAFGTNIGSCMDFLAKGKKYDLYIRAKSITEAMSRHDAYSALKVLSAVRSRDEMLELLDMLDKIVRDAVAVKLGASKEYLGCCPAEANDLSHAVTADSAQRIHRALGRAQYLCGSSVYGNMNAAVCILSSELCG